MAFTLVVWRELSATCSIFSIVIGLNNDEQTEKTFDINAT